MRITVVVAMSFALITAGCMTSSKPSPAPTVPAGQATPKIGPGTVLTDALTEAHCANNGQGVWAAKGVVTNTTKQARAFDVTIHVGPPDGKKAVAHVTHVKTLAPGKTATWSSPVVESNSPGGPCHIQVRVAR